MNLFSIHTIRLKLIKWFEAKCYSYKSYLWYVCKERRAYSLCCETLETIFKAGELFPNQRDCLYFQTYSDTFQLKNIPLEEHGFNKIVPSLCFFEEARKSLLTRYLCISVIQREQERGINSRPNWPYTSDVLFRYEKPNWKQH